MPPKPHDDQESSLTALLLGELPHDQAAALHQKLAQDAELAKLYERLKHTINLVRETITSPAAQTADQPTPLKLSDQRRQKLLQQFKTVAPKEFARPRRRAMPWLVPVGIAAGLVVILGGLLLPALSKAKSHGQSLAFRTWSLSGQAESAPLAPPVAGSPRRYEDLDRNGRMGRIASEGRDRSGSTPIASSLEEAPPPAKPAGSAIVLPQSSEVADATTTTTVAEGVNSWSASAANRGFYDDSSSRAGGMGGGGAFGGFKSRAPSDAPTAGHAGNVERLAETATPAVVPPPTVTAAPTEDLPGKAATRHSILGPAPALTEAAPADSLEVARVPLQTHGTDETAGDRVAGLRALVPSGQATDVKNAGYLVLGDDAARLASANKLADTTVSARRIDRFGVSESLITAPKSTAATPLAALASPQQDGQPKQALASGSSPYITSSYYGGGAYGGYSSVEQLARLADPRDLETITIPNVGDVTVLRDVRQKSAEARPSAQGETAPSDTARLSTEAAGQVLDMKPPEVNLKAKFVEIKQDEAKAVGFDWYLGNMLKNQGSIKAQGGTAPPDQAGKSAGAFDFGVAAAGTETLNYQRRYDASAQPGLANSDGDKVPILGDVPVVDSLFRSTTGAAGGSVEANTYSLGVVGYVNGALTATNSIAVAPVESSTVERSTRYRQLSQLGTDVNGASRVAQSPIVLPAPSETGLTLKDGSRKDVQLFAAAKQPGATPVTLEDTRKQGSEDAAPSRTYFEAKRQLDELQRFRQILDAKIAYEKIDVDLPKTMMVEVVDKAVPASSPSSTLWEKIRGKTGDFKSTARIKVERDQSDISGMAERGGMAGYDPYFVQTEFEAIQSEAVLGKVAEDLNLKEAWAGKKGAGEKLTTAEAVQLLKQSLDLRPVRNTSLLEIGVKSDKPEEAARIANAVAEAYKVHRHEQRMQLSKAGTKALEERYAEQEEKVREAQKKVDDLRVKLNISDAMASGDGPSPLMSADTLRKLESLRIESKAELVREQTLVDRLKQLGKEQGTEKLAQAIPSAAPDPQLSSLLEQLTVAKQRRLALENEYGPTHPDVLKSKTMAEDLDTKIKSRVGGIMLGLDARVLSLSNSLDNLEKEIAKATQIDIERANQSPKADMAPSKPAAPAPIPQPEVQTAENAFSTFSLNVSDVSFKLAAASLEKGVMPEPANVRSEEFINAFDYRDPEPPPGVPVAFAWERAQYPFAQNRDLLRFSIKTAAQGRQPGRPLNLVLLLDNSGSMERADRVQIIHEALRVLAGQLQPQDKFSVVTFARTAHLWVDGVPGNQAAQVAEEVSGLTPQGGTNLEDAMNLAYQTALRHYLANGVNRVVLLTDGAANLGNVDPEALKQKVDANRKQGVALDCFGIGWEGYNDDLLEVLTRNGDGRYAFLNTPEEVADEFAAKLAGALQVAASDVKVQVEFNPARVTAYRQIGYAKHQLTKEQFRDNTVNAAQIGAAEAGNALYTVEVNPNDTGPLCTVRVRFRIPGTADYREHAWDVPFNGNAVALEQASPAMRLAATGSALSEWLVSSPYATEVTPDRLLGYLSGVPEVYGADARPKKLEWMIRQAKSIAGK